MGTHRFVQHHDMVMVLCRQKLAKGKTKDQAVVYFFCLALVCLWNRNGVCSEIFYTLPFIRCRGYSG